VNPRVSIIPRASNSIFSMHSRLSPRYLHLLDS
jgi:hypothetical protein